MQNGPTAFEAKGRPSTVVRGGKGGGRGANVRWLRELAKAGGWAKSMRMRALGKHRSFKVDGYEKEKGHEIAAEAHKPG